MNRWTTARLVGCSRIQRLLVGIGFVAALSAGLWALAQSAPLLPPIIGLLLFLLGAVWGLRIGSEATDRLVKDLNRLNKCLVDQNADLAEQNHFFMKKLLKKPKTTEGVDLDPLAR